MAEYTIASVPYLAEMGRLTAKTPLSEFQRVLRYAFTLREPLRSAVIKGLSRSLGRSLTSGTPNTRDQDAFLAAIGALQRHVPLWALQDQAGAAQMCWLAPEYGKSLKTIVHLGGKSASKLMLTSIDDELNEIAHMGNAGVRGRALAMLAGQRGIPRKAQRKAIELAAGLWVDDDQARALGALGPTLGQPELAMALDAAAGIQSPAARLLALASLTPNFSRVPRALPRELSKVVDELHLGHHDSATRRSFEALEPSRGILGQDLEQRYEHAMGAIDFVEIADPLAKSSPSESAGMSEIAADMKTMEAEVRAAVDSPVAEPKSARPRLRQRRARVVSAGFADATGANRAITPTTTLAAKQKYTFWAQIGARQRSSTVKNPTTLLSDEHLAAGTRVEVVLFNPTHSFGIENSSARGELVMTEAGEFRVLRQPGDKAGVRYSGLRSRRLLFPVTAPEKPGRFNLRCNVYVSGNLVQSLRVSATVSPVPRRRVDGAVTTIVDYSLSSLSATHLRTLTAPRMSIMLNQSSDGAVTFMFYGKSEDSKPDFRQEVVLEADEVQNLVDIGRGALRTAAWGDSRPWDPERGFSYRYSGPDNPRNVGPDLIALARAGYRMYDRIVDELKDDPEGVEQLKDLMRAPGVLQLALKKNPSHVFPAALIYDYDIDTNAELTLCPTFQQALDSSSPLGKLPCFHGDCPAANQINVVCPGGFWGYRHAIGLPLTPGKGRDAAITIQARADAEFAVAVSTDPEFTLRDEHIALVKSTCNPQRWSYAQSREDALSEMHKARPHLVYFYCHGGVNKDKVPFLQVGGIKSDGITRDNLRVHKISWKHTRPLVILNGCRTTALEPEAALDLVSGFVRTANAAGVIGTEITIFEPLACSFAEHCLSRFFVDGKSIGEAVRDTRLSLLADRNPLGLVYIPYVYSQLRVT